MFSHDLKFLEVGGGEIVEVLLAEEQFVLELEDGLLLLLQRLGHLLGIGVKVLEGRDDLDLVVLVLNCVVGGG